MSPANPDAVAWVGPGVELAPRRRPIQPAQGEDVVEDLSNLTKRQLLTWVGHTALLDRLEAHVAASRPGSRSGSPAGPCCSTAPPIRWPSTSSRA